MARYLLVLCFLLLAHPVWSDGLAVPGRGVISVVDLATIRVSRTVELPGEAVPMLAVHPADSVLATLSSSSGLRFWNLPDFSEASQFEDPLLEGVVDLAFSSDGTRLYLLSQELKAVLVYDLGTSTISQVWPIPGGTPVSLSVGTGSLGVLHKDGASVLDPASGSLKFQFRFGLPVKGALLDKRVIYLSVADGGGVSRYRADNGARLDNVGGGGAYAQLLQDLQSGRLYMVHESESLLEARDGNGGTLAWSSELGQGPHYVMVSRDGKWVYASSRSLKSVAVLEQSSGRELGKLPLQQFEGRPVIYGTAP